MWNLPFGVLELFGRARSALDEYARRTSDDGDIDLIGLPCCPLLNQSRPQRALQKSEWQKTKFN
jgi:hypothetical protein